MKVLRLEISNFRKFDSACFTLNPNFNILVGDNAAGKTAIIEAIGICVGTYLCGIAPRESWSIRPYDVRHHFFSKGGVLTSEPQLPARVKCRGRLHGEELEWFRELWQLRGKTNRSGASELISRGRIDEKKIQKGEDVTLPVIAYYGTRRLWQAKRDVVISQPDSRTTGYRDCLDPASNHYLFLKWFKKLELSSLQRNTKISLLEAVRSTVKECVPGADEFFYDVASDQLMLKIGGEYFQFNELSDGYRNMVAMVADIAHRASRLNPHFEEEAAQKTPGVVLIDEIDLHLHPNWQRQVVGDLRRALPEIQFIATTHSPFIIQSLEANEVIDLNPAPQETCSDVGDQIATPAPKAEYLNKSIEDITEDIMGVDMPQRSLRYKKMTETAKQYFILLQQGRAADPAEKARIKQELDKLLEPFSDNPAYHAFLEMERTAAGLANGGEPEAEENEK
jgi:predicted ATP-binding protein involved in virulence